MPSTSPLRIFSWNVNGIRACAGRGFGDWLATCEADVVLLQEFRALPEQTPPELQQPNGWHWGVHAAQRKGYSGVAFYARIKPDAVEEKLGVDEFDTEGRVQFLTFGKLVLGNIYFPNGSGKERDNSRVPYKLAFTDRVFERAEELAAQGNHVVILGDYNTAHKEIDIARPKENRKTSGFLPQECEHLSGIINRGWIDTLRAFDASPNIYTWWSQRGAARAKNVGWRIDYAIAHVRTMPFVKRAVVHADVVGSDHCPISVELDRQVLDA